MFELGHNYPSLGVTADIVEQQVGVVKEKTPAARPGSLSFELLVRLGQQGEKEIAPTRPYRDLPVKRAANLPGTLLVL